MTQPGVWRRRRIRTSRPANMFTIKDVGDACGLPGPVIMQWVPRTWVDGHGWMFTAEQLRAAVEIAEEYRRDRDANAPLPERDPGNDAVVCDGRFDAERIPKSPDYPKDRR